MYNFDNIEPYFDCGKMRMNAVVQVTSMCLIRYNYAKSVYTIKVHFFAHVVIIRENKMIAVVYFASQYSMVVISDTSTYTFSDEYFCENSR